MRIRTIALCLLATTAGALAVDEVVLSSGLPYSGSQVKQVLDGQLVFKTSGGRELRKPLKEIGRINLGREVQYNEAESLLANKKYEAAAAKFESLTGPSRNARVRALAPWRAMAAWDKAGRIDKSVVLWLNLLADKPGPGVLAAQPTTVGAKGSAANAAAITALQGRLDAGKDSAAVTAAIKAALAMVYTAEGRAEDAMKLAGNGGTVIPGPPSGSNGGEVSPPSVGAASQQVKLADLQLQQNNPTAALKLITDSLPRFRDRDLADALWVAGQARMKLSASATPEKGRALWIEAGLDFMRVYAYWPESPHAPGALFEAGRVCGLLGNPAASRAAYERVVAEYEDSPWAAKARAELGKNKTGS